MFAYYIYLVLCIPCMKSYFPESWIIQDYHFFRPISHIMKGWNSCGILPLPLKMLLSSISFFLWVNQNNLAILGCLWSCQYYFLFLFEELSSKEYRWPWSCAPHSVVCFTTKPKSSLTKFLSFAYSLLIHYSVSTFTRFIKLFAIEWPLVIPLAYNEKQRIIGSLYHILKVSGIHVFLLWLCVSSLVKMEWDGGHYIHKQFSKTQAGQ